MNKLVLSALGAAVLSVFGATNTAHAQVVVGAPITVTGNPTVSTSLTATVAGYITDGTGIVVGLQLDNGSIAIVGDGTSQQIAASAPIGTVVRVDGLIDPAAPQTIQRAAIYSTGGAVLVAPPVVAPAYVPGPIYGAYTGYAPRPYYVGPRTYPYQPYVGAHRPYYPAPVRPTWVNPGRPAYAPPAYVAPSRPSYVPPAVAVPVRPGGPAYVAPAMPNGGGFRGGPGFQGGFHGGGFHGGRR